MGKAVCVREVSVKYLWEKKYMWKSSHETLMEKRIYMRKVKV